jgi:hypothetical protein
VYPIKHKLKDCGIMKNFMTSRSLTEDKEPEEDLGGREAMPFPREDAIIIVSDGCPPLERSRMSNLSPDTRTHCGREPRDIGCKDTSFSIYIYIYYSYLKRKNDRRDSLGPQGWQLTRVQSQRLPCEACSSCRRSIMRPTAA